MKNMNADLRPKPRVVVVGGGFGGISCVRRLARAPVDITLFDRSNHTLFQPLLYQVATGVLDDSSIAAPLRRVLADQKNLNVVKSEVKEFDFQKNIVISDELEVPWDHLVIAAGVQTNYFGNDWEKFAPGLKTLEDAHDVRARVLEAFEQAELFRVRGDLKSVSECLTFVVVGAGATGVEVSGAIKQLAVDRLAREFPNLDVSSARVILGEGGDRVLSSMSTRSSKFADKTLRRYGIEIRKNTKVTSVNDEGVSLLSEDGEDFIAAKTVVWGAGVKASPIAKTMAAGLGIETSPFGTIVVGGDLSIPTRPDIRVIGDIAYVAQSDGTTVPGVAQGAIQMGSYVGDALRDICQGRKNDRGPFEYRDKGSLATIGRGQAVMDVGRFHIAGFIGWIVWAIVHIWFLINFRSRLMAMAAWVWAYVVQDGVNELITKKTSGRFRLRKSQVNLKSP